MNQIFKSLLSVCALFASYTSFTQQPQVDSLKELLVKTKYPIEKIDVYNQISVFFFKSQLYNDSSYYYNRKAYQIAKEYKLPEKEGRALFNFGLIYSEMGNANLAIENYIKALSIFERLHDSRNLSVINSSIAALYFNEKKYEKAIMFFEKAIEISIRNKDSIGMAIDYVNLGETEYKASKYKSSKEHLELGRQISKKKNLDHASLYVSYSNTLFALQEIDSAEKEAEIGLLKSIKDRDLKNISEASDVLYRISYQKEDYKKALKHYQRYTVYNDSVEGAKGENTIEKLLLNAELRSKEEELSRLKEKTKYMNIIYVLVGLGILLLIFLISKQIKVIKMTEDMHKIQSELIGEGLKERNLKQEDGE